MAIAGNNIFLSTANGKIADSRPGIQVPQHKCFKNTLNNFSFTLEAFRMDANPKADRHVGNSMSSHSVAAIPLRSTTDVL